MLELLTLGKRILHFQLYVGLCWAELQAYVYMQIKYCLEKCIWVSHCQGVEDDGKAEY